MASGCSSTVVEGRLLHHTPTRLLTPRHFNWMWLSTRRSLPQATGPILDAAVVHTSAATLGAACKGLATDSVALAKPADDAAVTAAAKRALGSYQKAVLYGLFLTSGSHARVGRLFSL